MKGFASRVRLLRRAVLLGLPFVLTTVPAAAAANSPGSPYDRRVTTVEVKPAWLAAGASLPLRPGDTLTPAKLSAALNAVKDTIGVRADRYGRATGSSLLTVTYVEPEFTLGENDDVAVTLRPFYVALPLGSMGKLALPVPRELPPGQLRHASTALPAQLGLSSDRTIGLAVDGDVKLTLGGKGGATPPFSFQATGQQSLENSYHTATAAFRFGRTQNSGFLRNVYAAGEGFTAEQPWGEARTRTHSGGIRMGVGVAPWRSSRLQFDSSYQRADERFEERSGAGLDDSPDVVSTRLLFERIPRTLGFVRASVWHDVRRSRGASTQRLIGRIGYAREWLVRPNQGIGFEIVAGAGELWGVSPERRRFHGGAEAGSFLYDAAEAALLLKAPDGPVVRSLGRAQAALPGRSTSTTGGTRFRHVSLNVSLPIPKWSRPLIPDESVEIPGPDGQDLTIKDMLRNQIDRSGPNLLASTLTQSEQLAPADALRRAQEIFGEIQPAAHYIIDRANVFAIKPLLLFDAATLGDSIQSESWTAAGAGLQLTVVTARLDAAYMRTLSGPSRSKYNVVVRLGFERLF